MECKVSIVMGIYNCEKYLAESIESILNQTYKEWELIMCDDGSIDNTVKIASEYVNKYPDKIKLLINEKNMGLNYTLNKCILHAKGEYIARQDGDDVSLPNRLEIEMRFLEENPEYSLVSSNMIFFDEKGDWGRSHNYGELKKENFIKGSPICHAPCVIKTEALKDVGCYSVDEKLLRVEDYHLWFKLFIAGYKCYSLEETLYKMRDDNDAYKRRNLKNRINETRLKLWGFKKIKIPIYKYIWAVKPIIAFLLPKKIYQIFHYKNLKQNTKGDKVKILYFVGSMNCGGTETMLMNVFRKLNKEKYEVFFMVNNKEEGWYDKEILNLGGKILRIKKIEEIGFRNYIKYLTNIFKEEKFDVIHSHTFLHSGFVMKAAKKAGVNIRIAHSHSDMDHFEKNIKYKIKKRYLKRLILKNATHLLACSTEAGTCLFGNVFKTKGTIIKNSVRIEEIKKTMEKQELKEKIKKQYNINENQLIIGHVGRFVEIKNHKFILEIAKELRKQRVNFKLFLVGDGELLEKTKKECYDKGLEESVIFTGNIQNVYEYINVFDVFLLPSFYEGLPLTVIEAQGFGKKCLISQKISREADLNMGLVKFLDIDSGVDIWIKKILEKNSKENKIKTIQTLVNNGYDIESVIKTLENVYCWRN